MSEQALPSDARVFAVASGKGGVGKTTTAVTVGAALAASGAETVVVDADLGMANVADLLDVSISGPTLQDVLAGELAVEKATYRTHEGLTVVPGATDLASYAEVDPERLRAVVESLRAEFEYVFLDAGAGLSYDAALPLGLADAVVLVTTPRETAARDAGKTRELAERIDATVAGVVVTRVREEPSELGPDAVAERVGAPVLTAVPEDAAVREALSAGRPVVIHAPESLVTAAYRRLAAVLAGHEASEPIDAANGSTDVDDPTSLAELLERESDHPVDVSALTGDSASDSGSIPDAAADSNPDDPPTLDLGTDLAGDSADEPAIDEGDDSEPSPAAASPDEGSDTGIDGDVPLEEGTTPDAGEAEPADDPSRDQEGPGEGKSGDDPMADIPRIEDDSDEELTRGDETADPLAADPLAADPVDDAVAPTDEDVDVVADDAGPDATDAGEEDGASEDDADDGKPVGPHVEGADPGDDAGGKGLLGRLAGLFR